MKPIDWTLLVLAAANGRPLTPVHLQKCLFLIGKNVKPTKGDVYYDFFNHHYGPFCPQVYDDVKVLVTDGLAVAVASPGERWVSYAVSPEGIRAAQVIEGRVDPKFSKYVNELVAWAIHRDFEEIVSAIYHLYPETKENSIFRGISR